MAAWWYEGWYGGEVCIDTSRRTNGSFMMSSDRRTEGYTFSFGEQEKELSSLWMRIERGGVDEQMKNERAGAA